MASQRASKTKELLRESLESVLKPFKIYLFVCVTNISGIIVNIKNH